MSGLRCPHHAARLGRRLHSATAAPAPPRCIRRRRRSASQPFDKILRQIAHSSLCSSHTICRKISLSVSPPSAHCARRRVSEANRAVGPALRPEIVRRRRRIENFLQGNGFLTQKTQTQTAPCFSRGAITKEICKVAVQPEGCAAALCCQAVFFFRFAYRACRREQRSPHRQC